MQKKHNELAKISGNSEEVGRTCPTDGVITKDATQLATGISARSVALGPDDQSPVRQMMATRRMHAGETIERTTTTEAIQPVPKETKEVPFSVYGDTTSSDFSFTFTATDSSGDKFTINGGSENKKTIIDLKQVRKNVIYSVVANHVSKDIQQKLIQGLIGPNEKKESTKIYASTSPKGTSSIQDNTNTSSGTLIWDTRTNGVGGKNINVVSKGTLVAISGYDSTKTTDPAGYTPEPQWNSFLKQYAVKVPDDRGPLTLMSGGFLGRYIDAPEAGEY